MIGDRDLLTFRQGYYELFVALLWKEPAGELVSALAPGIAERMAGARNLHPLLGQGWHEIAHFLDGTSRDRLGELVAEEYTRIFFGPHDPQIHPYESYYLTGRLLDRPLADIRSFLKEVGIEKQEGYAEPEDFLAFELEIMRRLVARQASASNRAGEADSLDHQATFLKRHLLVWGPDAAADLAKSSAAVFYRGVAHLLGGFLAFERDLFEKWGPVALQSLEEARQSHAKTGEWKGPLFEISQILPENSKTHEK
jgi:TorA maturation chaperone TorD